jgi:fumarate hydratase subunit alpha
MIRFKTLSDTAARLYEVVVKTVPKDVEAALKKAYKGERNPIGKKNLEIMLENIKLAERNNTLVCHDAGMPIYYLKVGTKARVEGDIRKAIAKGVSKAVRDVPLEPDICHPLRRECYPTNVGEGVPIIHFDLIHGSRIIELTATSRGGGPETCCVLKVFGPDKPRETVRRFVLQTISEIGVRPCPPIIVGVGIGGSFDSVALLSAKASLRPLNIRNANPEIAAFERDLLKEINLLGIGSMGLGGTATALGVNIEVADTTVVWNPVALTMTCWTGRRASARIFNNNKVAFF